MAGKSLDTESILDVEVSTTHIDSRDGEKLLVRKLDLYLTPLLGILKMLQQYERIVITSAVLGGLLEDLSMTSAQYRLCLTVFYLGDIFLNVPCSIIIRRWRPSRFFAFVIFSWGVLGMATAGVRNFAGLVTIRFLLGAFESVCLPGTAYYLTLWYTRQEYSKRLGYLYIVSCVAGATGGLIAYGISQMSTDRLHTWQWMFILEGAPCIVFAFIIYYYLPDHPRVAKFLTDDEKEMAETRVAADQGVADDVSWSWIQVKSAFTDWKTYFYIIIYITSSMAGIGITLTLPSIIDGLGSWDEDVSLALTTPPYALACLLIFALSWSSDNFFERSLHLICGNLLMMTGLLLLMFCPFNWIAVRYFAICLTFGTSYMIYPIKGAWFNNNFSGLTRRAVANGIIHTFVSVGSAIGGQIYFDGPHYFWGNTISFTCLVVQLIVILALRIILDRINKKRDKMTPEQKEQEVVKYQNPDLVGDRHPEFRYVL